MLSPWRGGAVCVPRLCCSLVLNAASSELSTWLEILNPDLACELQPWQLRAAADCLLACPACRRLGTHPAVLARPPGTIPPSSPSPHCRAKWKGKGKKKKKKKSEDDDLYALLGLQHEASRGRCTSCSLPPAGTAGRGRERCPRCQGGTARAKKGFVCCLRVLLHVQQGPSCLPPRLPVQRWTANEAQIKAAYRKAALLHHPDKQVWGRARLHCMVPVSRGLLQPRLGLSPASAHGLTGHLTTAW